jgi:hypothetical protein
MLAIEYGHHGIRVNGIRPTSAKPFLKRRLFDDKKLRRVLHPEHSTPAAAPISRILGLRSAQLQHSWRPRPHRRPRGRPRYSVRNASIGRRLMRTTCEFKTEDGVALRGWHYVPDGRRGKSPTIVMAHGFSAVKEMYLDRFADAFAAAAWPRLCSIIVTSAQATVNLGKTSIHGARCATIATRSATLRRWARPTPTASGSGDRVIAAAMSLWSVRLIAG